jgi:type IX secretion system PorP/SprF family membrane protein
MKIHMLSLLFFSLLSIPGQAQSRKYISQFSHFQSYFNPGLTGYEGSTARGFVRNQWSGIEGAPTTYFISAELDLADLSGLEDPALMGKNAVSASVFHDSYGAFRETGLLLSYASRVRLTTKHTLRLGAGLNYQSVRLDGNSLTAEQANDPMINKYVGGFSDMRIIDFNIGLALTHQNYYLSYSLHNVNKGRISSGDSFMDGNPVAFMAQAGYREQLGEQISIVVNGFYRRQEGLPDNIELNMKALLMEKIWVGVGHRFDYANNLQFGVLMDRMRVGYIFEFPTNGGLLLPGRTHEFTLIYRLFDSKNGNSDRQMIW